ncbi:hypothetical protein ES708_13681 [subsurface metagenome]
MPDTISTIKPLLKALLIGPSIEVLQDLLTTSPQSPPETRRSALLTALFVLCLLERGDLTYEPMPK